MAIILPNTCPWAATYTFVDGNQNQLSLIDNLPMKYTNTIVVTNLDDTNNVYISPKTWATSETEEYTLKPGLTISFDWREDAQFDLFIRGTSASKITYFIC